MGRSVALSAGDRLRLAEAQLAIAKARFQTFQTYSEFAKDLVPVAGALALGGAGAVLAFKPEWADNFAMTLGQALGQIAGGVAIGATKGIANGIKDSIDLPSLANVDWWEIVFPLPAGLFNLARTRRWFGDS